LRRRPYFAAEKEVKNISGLVGDVKYFDDLLWVCGCVGVWGGGGVRGYVSTIKQKPLT